MRGRGADLGSLIYVKSQKLLFKEERWPVRTWLCGWVFFLLNFTASPTGTEVSAKHLAPLQGRVSGVTGERGAMLSGVSSVAQPWVEAPVPASCPSPAPLSLLSSGMRGDGRNRGICSQVHRKVWLEDKGAC